jgi:hypothetical protein
MLLFVNKALAVVDLAITILFFMATLLSTSQLTAFLALIDLVSLLLILLLLLLL